MALGILACVAMAKGMAMGSPMAEMAEVCLIFAS